MLPSLLVIVVAAATLLGTFAWSRWGDGEDDARKIVVSVVQVMCLMAIVAGVVGVASKRAAGPDPADEPAVASVPSDPVATPHPSSRLPASNASASIAAAHAREAAENLRRTNAQGEEDRRRNDEEIARRRAAGEPLGEALAPPPDANAPRSEPEPTPAANAPVANAPSEGPPPAADPPPANEPAPTNAPG